MKFLEKLWKKGCKSKQVKVIVIENSKMDDDAGRFQDQAQFFEGFSGLTALFHDWWEYRMASYHWGLSIFHGEEDLSQAHTDITFNAGREAKRYRLPDNYQPWVMRGEALVLLSQDQSGLQIYYPKKRILEQTPHTGLVGGLVCSPELPRIAIAKGAKNVQLIDLEGSLIAELPIRGPDSGRSPFLAWLKSGRHLLGISRSSNHYKPSLMVFDGKTGALLHSIDLNPEELVPYDHKKFSVIDRELGFPLLTSPNSGAMGRLLDDWDHIELENGHDILHLEIQRPVGELLSGARGPGPQDLGPNVHVERRKIKAQLIIPNVTSIFAKHRIAENMIESGLKSEALELCQEIYDSCLYDAESCTRSGDHSEASKAEREAERWYARIVKLKKFN
ncbi:MAG: hypothetical protein HQL69_17480 [Magnetococcales bacterium]|nr:hypothetical protein [Magnetococcales bacterium]